MIKLLEFSIRILCFIFIICPICIGFIILAIILWDSTYMDILSMVGNYAIKSKKSKYSDKWKTFYDDFDSFKIKYKL